MDYEPIVSQSFVDDWQTTFTAALKKSTPKDRHGSLLGPHDGCSLVFMVAPATRRATCAYRSFAYLSIFEHPDVPEDEVHMARIDRDVLTRATRDAEAQPVAERWHRAWIIAGSPGAYGMDPVRQVYGHLHHAETA